MVISDCTVGMGITGSFCSFEKTKDVAKRLVDSFTHVTPVYSYNAHTLWKGGRLYAYYLRNHRG